MKLTNIVGTCNNQNYPNVIEPNNFLFLQILTIKQQIEKDVDEVGEISFHKIKIGKLDREFLRNAYSLRSSFFPQFQQLDVIRWNRVNQDEVHVYLHYAQCSSGSGEPTALFLSPQRPSFKDPSSTDMAQNGSQLTFFLTVPLRSDFLYIEHHYTVQEEQ
ncbi:protein SCAI-like [Forsythia ovata]|uniref:Protein SCAI-like n=1 Tax=Forsythia ovata TaxID=205694 RepID=A0ABD1XBZ0_9LAMI